jgi:hypothetical protein
MDDMVPRIAVGLFQPDENRVMGGLARRSVGLSEGAEKIGLGRG